jgi:hypothetical protein
MQCASDCIWSTITNTHPSNHLFNGQPNTSREAPEASSPTPTGLPRESHDHSDDPRTAFVAKSDWMSGYAQMVTDRVRGGWSCYLVTFLFDQLPGSRATAIHQMKDRVQGVYSRLVTRVNRKPRNASPDGLPVLIGFADLPVYKRDRSSLHNARCNDGIHFHALVLLPPKSRLKESLVDHLRRNEEVYARPGMSIQRIHAESVIGDHERVVDYALKTVRRRRISYEDAVLVLPRSRSEL